MMKKALFALAISGAMATAQAGIVFTENFNNVPALADKGWVFENAGTPGGITPGWYQGAPAVFSAKNGPANSYAAANYQNAASGGLVDSWLITPEFSTTLGATVSFWLRAAADAGFSDQIAFGKSTGSSALDAFTLSPVITVNTGEWIKYTVSFAAIEGTARLALNYTGEADFLNYVGLDNLTINQVPEPSSILILAAGAMGLVAARRRKRA